MVRGFISWIGVWLAVGAVMVPADDALAKGKARGGHVIEFRSRPGDYFGHGYVVVGRETRGGRIAATRTAGFVPDPKASAIEAAGRVKGVVAYTAEDRAIAPDERYRVRVSRAAHDRAVANIDANKRRKPTFGLFEQNCNTFVGRVARAARLEAPDNDVTLPRDYVRNLRALNDRTARNDR